MIADVIQNNTGEVILGVISLVLALLARGLHAKYSRAWKALQVVALFIEAADKPGTSVEDNAKAIKAAIAELTQAKPEGKVIHEAARQAEVAVYEMKKVP